MTTFDRQTKNTIPVGQTPVPKYATWEAHRDAMRRDAELRREAVDRRSLPAA